jgi:2-oxoglutarate ferredoxin oxidoreductase subunit alpha
MSRARGGVKLGILRPITLWPFPKEAVRGIAGRIRDILVVEMSFGQMYEDVLISACGLARVSLLARTGGGIPTEDEILAGAEKAMKSSGPVEMFPDAS